MQAIIQSFNKSITLSFNNFFRPCRFIDCLEQGDDPAAVFAGDEWGTAFADGIAEVGDLQAEEIARRVDLIEEVGVFFDEFR